MAEGRGGVPAAENADSSELRQGDFTQRTGARILLVSGAERSAPAIQPFEETPMSILHAILLGIIEGITEFLPISSTGHLVLADRFLGLTSTGTFKVLIQLGAILAIVTVYFAKLWKILVDLPSDRRTQLFVLAIFLAFLPAAFVGATFHTLVKSVLLESPMTVCISLIVGGIILLLVDRWTLKPVYHDLMDIPPLKALAIGAFQCLALVPGVSRSGSTIVGAMLLGVDKVRAAEFSFFPGHADDGRRLRLRPLQEPQRDYRGGRHLDRRRLHGVVRRRRVRRQIPARLRRPARLRAVRLVAHHRRRARRRRVAGRRLRSSGRRDQAGFSSLAVAAAAGIAGGTVAVGCFAAGIGAVTEPAVGDRAGGCATGATGAEAAGAICARSAAGRIGNRQPLQHLVGECPDGAADLAWILGGEGTLLLAVAGRMLDGVEARQHRIEAAVLGVLGEPTVILVVGRRTLVLHVDDDAEVLGEAHLRVQLPEAVEHVETAHRDVVGLGRRNVEIRLAQPALGQHR